MIRGVQVAGAAPIVRLPDDSPEGIMKALDAGAVGIYIPHVSNPDQAERIVRAARYAPAGTRGACPRVRATSHGVSPWKEHVEWSNQNIMVWLLIETLEGFENFEGIIAVPGIDAVAFGAVDLSQAMGLNGQTDHPEVRKKIERAVNLAKEKHVDVKMSVSGLSPQEIQSSARRWADLGVRIFSSVSDRRILSIRWKEALSHLEPLRRVLK
jgi:2-keto-3-deoxy-L-rhamnonate aldolase RhmA